MCTADLVHCDLVATVETLAEHFPGRVNLDAYHEGGIMSATFSFSPSECKSKFGAWLARNIRTTRRDDDLSVLNIELNTTHMEMWVQDLAKSMNSVRMKSDADFERELAKIEGQLQNLRSIKEMHGPDVFKYRTIAFEWPVLGSRAAEHIKDPAAYFDLCARRIRQMRPRRVWVMATKAQPPASLQVGSAA